MALSKESLKNLFDVLQKLSLAIAAVSAVLIVNAQVFFRIDERKALAELNQVLGVHRELKSHSPIDLLLKGTPRDRGVMESAAWETRRNSELAPEGVTYEDSIEIQQNPKLNNEWVRLDYTLAQIATADGKESLTTLVWLQVPTVICSFSDPISAEEPLDQDAKLKDFIRFWNTVSGGTVWIYKDKIEEMFVSMFPGTELPKISLKCDLLDFRDYFASGGSPGSPVIKSNGDFFLLDATQTHYHVDPLVKDERTRGLVTEWYLKLRPRRTGSVEIIEWPNVPFLTINWAKVKQDSPAKVLDKVLGAKGDFVNAFPNLAALTVKLQETPLSSLASDLDKSVRESNKETKDIDILGVKITSSLIPLFGLCALIALLFQFSALANYIAANVQRIDGEQASQWSFLIKGWAFLLFGFGTFIVLPTASTLLSWDSLFPLPTYVQLPEHFVIGLVGATVLSTLIAFISFVRLRSRVVRDW